MSYISDFKDRYIPRARQGSVLRMKKGRKIPKAQTTGKSQKFQLSNDLIYKNNDEEYIAITYDVWKNLSNEQKEQVLENAKLYIPEYVNNEVKFTEYKDDTKDIESNAYYGFNSSLDQSKDMEKIYQNHIFNSFGKGFNSSDEEYNNVILGFRYNALSDNWNSTVGKQVSRADKNDKVTFSLKDNASPSSTTERYWDWNNGTWSSRNLSSYNNNMNTYLGYVAGDGKKSIGHTILMLKMTDENKKMFDYSQDDDSGSSGDGGENEEITANDDDKKTEVPEKEPTKQDVPDYFKSWNNNNVGEFKKDFNIWPEIFATANVLNSNRATDKARDTLLDAWHPLLQNPAEYNSPIYGDFYTMKNASRMAAQNQYKASQAQTSDMSLHMANQRDIQNDADKLIWKGQQADNAAIRESLDEQVKNRHKSIESRVETANANAKSINETNKERAEIKADAIQQKASNWNKLLKYGFDETYANRANRRNANMQISATALSNQLKDQTDSFTEWYKLKFSRTDEQLASDGLYARLINAMYNEYYGNVNQLYRHPNWYYNYSGNGNEYVKQVLSEYFEDTKESKEKPERQKQGGKLIEKRQFVNRNKPVIDFTKQSYQLGGKFLKFYTEASDFNPDRTKKSSTTSISTKTKSDDDGLTEKDIFDMIKDIDGLPNEMSAVLGRFKKLLKYSNITGANSSALSSMYLKSLYQLKVINQNKKLFDEAYKKSLDKNALDQAAITPNGMFVVQDSEGGISTVTPQAYYSNSSKYRMLSNGDLAELRRFSPSMVGDSSSFTVLGNPISAQTVQEHFNRANVALVSQSTDQYSGSVLFSAAQKGLHAIQGLSDRDRQQLLTSMANTGTGLYSYSKKTMSNLQNIQAYLNYLVASVPYRAKVWMTTVTDETDPNKAAIKYVSMWLAGHTEIEQQFDVDYKSSKSSVGGSGNGGSDDGSQKIGFWGQVQRGMGGTPTVVQIQKGNAFLQVNGIQYGMSEGMQMGYQSLKTYLEDSKLPYIRSAKITFGDQVLADYDDVAINGADGITVATLPKNSDGTVNFKMLPEFNKITEKLEAEDLHPGDPNYNKRLNEEIEASGKFPSIYKDGHLNTEYYGNFILATGLASDKTLVKDGNSQKRISIGDTGSDWLQHNQDYEEDLVGALSTDDKEYKLDHEDGFEFKGTHATKHPVFGYDHVYQGVIYIPINNNLINGMNADDEDMKVPAAEEFERNAQDWQKRMSAGNSSADLLIGDN